MTALRAQLEAIRAGALAQAAMAEALLASMTPVPAEPEEKARALTAAGACAHPAERRISAARMGAPGAWHCDACGYEGEG